MSTTLARKLRRIGLVLLILILTISAVGKAQILPDAPQKHQTSLSHGDWTLLATDATVRTLDAWSTERALRCTCNQETGNRWPLGATAGQWVAHHAAAEYTYALSEVAGQYTLTRWMDKRGGKWRRWAKVLPAIDVAYDLPAVTGNLKLRTETSSRRTIR